MVREEQKLWYLEQFNLLNHLKAEEKKYMHENSVMVEFKRKQVIYFPFDESKTIYFLKKGKVKIAKYNDDGRELIYSILGQGEIFGELAMVEQSERQEIAETLEDCIICKINYEKFMYLLEHNPGLNLAVIKFIGLRLKRIRNKLENLLFKSLDQRVRSFIKEMAEDYGTRNSKNETVIKLNLTHQDIANLIASNRQSVTTELNELKKNNIIDYSRKEIIIKQPERL